MEYKNIHNKLHNEFMCILKSKNMIPSQSKNKTRKIAVQIKK